MPSGVQWPNQGPLQRRLDALAGLGSRRDMRKLEDAIGGIIQRRYQANVLAGRDRNGKPLTPLKSPRKGVYKGATGPPLAPFGVKSRFISAFRWGWKGGVYTAWLEDSFTKRVAAAGARVAGRFARVFKRNAGRRAQAPFRQIALYHLTGAGNNPRRDVSGVPLTAWREIDAAIAAYLQSLTK